MTSEELNRAIEFMIQHGAQLDLRLEKLEKMHERDHELLAQVTLRNEGLHRMIEIESHRLEIQSRRLEQEHRDHTALMDIQSRRLTRLEDEDREVKQQMREQMDGAQKRHDELMIELRDRLDRLFDKLS
jgi:hypothetical protein